MESLVFLGFGFCSGVVRKQQELDEGEGGCLKDEKQHCSTRAKAGVSRTKHGAAAVRV